MVMSSISRLISNPQSLSAYYNVLLTTSPCMQTYYLVSRTFRSIALRLPQVKLCISMSQFSSIPYDVQDFLDGYLNEALNARAGKQNLGFYSNKLKCRPDELLVEELLEKWKGHTTVWKQNTVLFNGSSQYPSKE
ncbi:hypothetical protein RSOLAG1IB_04848 [Rhizoctonia solani AG-1 IB]|uniref:Opioid growth factor receptor (OGFr) conserved domain-containing protein n=1 Tax=Thanatephorus cucumeris (strain AG1-IB / isolate 7/3/14) TaxID=1108050 RepID=A0A0B7G201_THACB|nr:hypothetical protein RSOLAG1IB_04848 [Rhizoctonia solani AG-1 IB]